MDKGEVPNGGELAVARVEGPQLGRIAGEDGDGSRGRLQGGGEECRIAQRRRQGE